MTPTLLLADDSVTIQRVVALTFADENIDVVAVDDGDQAIARIDSDPPDIVLADVGMPGRTGYDVARHIKQSSRLAHIPVVLLIGAFEPLDEARASAAGYDAVLAKPFEPQLVIARVKELLGRVGLVAASAPIVPEEASLIENPSRPPDVVRLDDYFEELDAAFANRPEATAPSPVQAAGLARPTIAEAASPVVGTAPPLADAFAALLAADERQPLPSPRSEWGTAPRAYGGSPNDNLVDAVTSRVLERLSETVTRERVADIVSAVAERLVRAEIERIKSSIT